MGDHKSLQAVAFAFALVFLSVIPYGNLLLLTQAAAHVKAAHNIQELSPEFLAQVRGAIHDE